jgi:uncharacterized damage-inducible protein DinB
MREVERITNQLERAISGDAWHGPAVMELLNGTNAEQAAARPVAGAHSIWELSLHIGAWLRACRRRLAGDRAQLTDAEDWPQISDAGEEAWKKAVESIKDTHGELASAILALDDSRLDEPILTGLSSVYVTLHGVIQHCLYHAGQIAVLKKALSEGKTE